MSSHYLFLCGRSVGSIFNDPSEILRSTGKQCETLTVSAVVNAPNSPDCDVTKATVGINTYTGHDGLGSVTPQTY